ncbi:hypothetical protein SCHPADRAFT_1000403 [Schizopora paradoxa]|uniref:Uncharacterized protein n=1 Tax=Schizopora paradoxa TaxID=27342 RepID=A0A0H2RCG6_9AGAM|nr:hypothetical protein SCHPADRAFT_1000403 [Schizopora paradoxa]
MGLLNSIVVTVARPHFAARRGRGVCHRGWRAAFMPRKGYSSRITERFRWIGHTTLLARPNPEAFSTRASTLLHQNPDVPVVPSTEGGVAAILSSSDIEIGRVVGSMRTVYVFIIEGQDRRLMFCCRD